jgi:TolA-binding protein
MSEIDTLGAAVAALNKRQVRVSWLTIGVVLLAFLGLGWYQQRSMRSYGEALGSAQAKVEMVQQSHARLLDELKADNQRQQELISQQKVVEKRIEYHTKEVQKEVEKVTAPDREAEETQKDVLKHYGFLPTFDGTDFRFTPPQTREVVKAKIERDAFQVELNDTKTVYSYEQEKNRLLAGDLGKAKQQLTDDRATIDSLNKDFKTVAKRTKKQIIWDGIEAGLALVGAVDVGVRLAKW